MRQQHQQHTKTNTIVDKFYDEKPIECKNNHGEAQCNLYVVTDIAINRATQGAQTHTHTIPSVRPILLTVNKAIHDLEE